MKFKLLLFVLFLSLATVFTACGASEAPAQDEQPPEPAEAALAAYRDILSAAPAIEGEHEELFDASFDYEQNQTAFGNHCELYAFHDIDRNGIPELIAQSTVNFRWTPVSVFTFTDGAAVLLKTPTEPDAHGTFEQMSTANGAYITYFCEDGHIHSVWCGTDPFGAAVEENSAYRLDGTSLLPVDCTAGESEHTVYFSDIAVPNV